MSERNRPDKGGIKSQLNLVGLKEGQEAPSIIVQAVGRDGILLHVAQVDNKGNFELPSEALKAANRIVIGPSEERAATASNVIRYRPAEFEELLRGPINVSARIWEKWYFFITCVTGRVRLCRRPIWWYRDLFELATEVTPQIRQLCPVSKKASLVTESIAALRPARSIDELIVFPFRCQKVCNGTVQVFRRTCCCRPWVIDDPRLFEVIRNLEDVVRRTPKFPRIPNPPDPPPDVADFFFKDGALDEFTVNAHRDLSALRTLSRTEVVEYVNARRYLYCGNYRCSAPVSIGFGSINPDGRFSICWFDTPRPQRPFCHDEYAYVVRQTLFGLTRIIYNGVASNEWFHKDDDALLTSYSRWAFACRDNGAPGTGAFVYLDLIGLTESWHLKTPNATGWDRVAAPAYNDGLAFPAATPGDAIGANLNRNWGGTLRLNYMFSEDMRSVGAKYYRISVTEADASGAPVGTRHFLTDGLSWDRGIATATGVDTEAVNLGPFTVGGASNLFLIPYDADPGEWNSGQYHGAINTGLARWEDPNKRHLVTVEVFDAGGQRLRPNGTPATGLPGAETTAAFTFRRRFQDSGPTDNVPFAALTHMFWWDNRSLEAEIVGLTRDNASSRSECQFLEGPEGTQFGINYRAYHPNEMFQLSHSIKWKRGLTASEGYLLPSSSDNVGQPPDLPQNSPTNTFAQMLDIADVPTRRKCAFTVFLDISSKITDGAGLNGQSAQDTAAFALEITS
ncbi:MAG TPA: hypothetical protein VFR12_00135 [Pyrinomonadaceae bacterium]|nr:hypothetical protein [Pyrinomonadaceae bacterium]